MIFVDLEFCHSITTKPVKIRMSISIEGIEGIIITI